MRTHHTKTKGDLGVIAAAYDLTKKGYRVLTPLTEHAPFDLVANRGDLFIRVQVKYRALTRGTITVRFTTCWADRHGVHTVPVDKSEVDLYCVYCPDTERCYYLEPQKFAVAVTLRVTPAANNQTCDVKAASDFLEIPERFSARPAGFEPAQTGLENRGSIRLSYGRESR